MQLLASLHIIFTCSFVFLLAYLLSRVFTFVAHAVIHGSRSKAAEGSSRGRRSESLKTKRQQEPDEDMTYTRTAVMVRLQEEDEEEDDDDDEQEEDDYSKEKGVYQDAEERTTTAHFEMGGAIFDDFSDQEYDVKRDGDAVRNNREGIIEREGLAMDARDKGKYEITTESEYRDINEEKGMKKLEDAEEPKEEKGGAPNDSVLGGAQGSSSMQQRLPPTWSDLERMVNLSSRKQSVDLPLVSQLPEYD